LGTLLAVLTFEYLYYRQKGKKRNSDTAWNYQIRARSKSNVAWEPGMITFNRFKGIRFPLVLYVFGWLLRFFFAIRCSFSSQTTLSVSLP
jgi:hypothetical protein